MFIKFEPYYFSTGEYTHLPSLIFEGDIPGIATWFGGQTKYVPESLQFTYEYDLNSTYRLVDDLLSNSNFHRVDAGA